MSWFRLSFNLQNIGSRTEKDRNHERLLLDFKARKTKIVIKKRRSKEAWSRAALSSQHHIRRTFQKNLLCCFYEWKKIDCRMNPRKMSWTVQYLASRWKNNCILQNATTFAICSLESIAEMHRSFDGWRGLLNLSWDSKIGHQEAINHWLYPDPSACLNSQGQI
jgi:hypothetical protein